jgi:hypothetical protein
LPLIAWSLIVTPFHRRGRRCSHTTTRTRWPKQTWAVYVRLVGTSDPLAYDLAKAADMVRPLRAGVELARARPSRANDAARNGNAPAGRIAI